jgi:hypothetical protein
VVAGSLVVDPELVVDGSLVTVPELGVAGSLVTVPELGVVGSLVAVPALGVAGSTGSRRRSPGTRSIARRRIITHRNRGGYCRIQRRRPLSRSFQLWAPEVSTAERSLLSSSTVQVPPPVSEAFLDMSRHLW